VAFRRDAIDGARGTDVGESRGVEGVGGCHGNYFPAFLGIL
jgi:hypothetical protein